LGSIAAMAAIGEADASTEETTAGGTTASPEPSASAPDEGEPWKAGPAPNGSAAGRPKGTKRPPPPPPDDGCCSLGCCLVTSLIVVLILAVILGVLYALDAPLPWHYLGLGGGPGLTKETWEEATAGKTAFVMFYAPWCGHCKRMKPAWMSLKKQYQDHPTIVVADVDCVGAGKTMCDEVGVRGFPTIKYGDPGSLSDYRGGRTYKDLSDFAAQLRPMCGPANMDICSVEEKAQIELFRSLGAKEREEQIKERQSEVEKLEVEFKRIVDSISLRYKTAEKDKDAAVKAIRDSGLNLLKAVESHVSQSV